MVSDELVQRVCDHLAGRPVVVRWQDPPTQHALGEVVRTNDGQFVVFVSPTLTGVDARLKVLLHEVGHVRDRGGVWIPKSNDHMLPSSSVTRSEKSRQEWRKDPREKTAQHYGDRWWKYANDNAWRHWRVGRDVVECKLLALLNWSGE